MHCDDFDRFIDPYLDDEFGARERTEVDLHLASCITCRERVDLQRALRHTVSVCANAERAPVALRDSIASALRLDQESADEPAVDVEHAVRRPATPTPAPGVGGWRDWTGWRFVSLAAAATLLVGLTGYGLNARPDSDLNRAQLTGSLPSAVESVAAPNEAAVIEESLDWHRRALPMEVAGPSGDAVRGWFQGKVDFPVRLPSFGQRNVAVLGGRLAKVGDHTAALVTLEVNHSKLSMMVFPADARRRVGPVSRDLGRPLPRVTVQSASGYNVAIVRDGDLAYSFVSDLSKPQLSELVNSAELR